MNGLLPVARDQPAPAHGLVGSFRAALRPNAALAVDDGQGDEHVAWLARTFADVSGSDTEAARERVQDALADRVDRLLVGRGLSGAHGRLYLVAIDLLRAPRLEEERRRLVDRLAGADRLDPLAPLCPAAYADVHRLPYARRSSPWRWVGRIAAALALAGLAGALWLTAGG